MAEKRIDSQRADERKAKFLNAISEGLTVPEASERAGWRGKNTYFKARQNDKMFAARVDALRAGRLADPEDPYAESKLPFVDFCDKFYPRIFDGVKSPPTATQLLIVDVLENLQPRDIVLVNLMPQSRKTATIEDYISRKLALDPTHRFRYMSESKDLAERVIGTIKSRMTDMEQFPDYIARFGPFYEQGQEKRGKPWTTSQITLAKNPAKERDRNLVASSITSSVLGSRIDTLIIDDVCSHRNYSQSEEIFRKIQGTFFTREFQMRTIVIGNRIGPGDVYERFADAGLVTREVILPACDEYGLHGPAGEPRDPDYWHHPLKHRKNGPCCKGFRVCPDNNVQLTPREYMEMMRHQVGEEQWSSMYQQNPKSNEVTTFSEYIDRCLDHDRELGMVA